MPISAEKKQQLRGKFARLDKNGDRSLDFEEMKILLRKGNPDMTERELKIVFAGVDTSGDGRINFDEFVNYLYGEQEESREVRGPERFFYDQSTYTGMHTGTGAGARNGSRGAFTASRNLAAPRSITVDGPGSRGSSREPSRSAGDIDLNYRRPSPGDDSSRPRSRQALEAPPAAVPNRATGGRPVSVGSGDGARPLRGPERFFYDKSSYTGVHQRGGPSTMDGSGPHHSSFRGGGR